MKEKTKQLIYSQIWRKKKLQADETSNVKAEPPFLFGISDLSSIFGGVSEMANE